MAVFLLSDAITLRKKGIKKPIVVLGGYDQSLQDAIDYNVDLVVFDWDSAEEIVALATKERKKVSVQIKVDTGLTRLGFVPEQVLKVAEFLLSCPYLSLTGMYTHFAESDAVDTSFTDEQITQMKKVVREIKRKEYFYSFYSLGEYCCIAPFSSSAWNNDSMWWRALWIV